MTFKLPFIGVTPNPFQVRILKDQADETWAVSGNRAGKTTASAWDMGLDFSGFHIWNPRFSTRSHPSDVWDDFLEYDEDTRSPVIVRRKVVAKGDPLWDPDEEMAGRAEVGRMDMWACAPDYLNVWKPNTKPILVEMFTAMGLTEGTGPRQYTWHESDRVFRIQMVTETPSGTYDWKVNIYGKSYDAGEAKFQAIGLARVWFDEEMPYGVYDEATMRIGSGFRRRVMVSMTPVQGLPWIREQIWDPYETGTLLSTRSVVRGSLFDNLVNLPEKDVDGLLEKYPEGSQERQMRFYGDFIQRTGLVYPDFKLDTHVIDDFYPWEKKEVIDDEEVTVYNEGWAQQYTLYRAIDVGWRNPTSCLFAAVNKEGEIFIYDEYYLGDTGLPDHVDNILAKSGETPFRWTVIDPATEQSDPVTGDTLSNFMAQRGLLTTPGNNRVIEGVAAVTEKLRVSPATNRAGLYICKRCVNGIREIRGYRWSDQSRVSRGKVDPKETPQKKDDHWVDALRYLVMSYPSHLKYRRAPEEYAGSSRTGY